MDGMEGNDKLTMAKERVTHVFLIDFGGIMHVRGEADFVKALIKAASTSVYNPAWVELEVLVAPQGKPPSFDETMFNVNRIFMVGSTHDFDMMAPLNAEPIHSPDSEVEDIEF